jgi:hypothetical protein
MLKYLRQWFYNDKKGHKFANHPELTDQFQWVPSGYPDFGSWYGSRDYMENDFLDQSYCNIIYGGHFGSTREQIKITPLKVYEALRKEQKYPREEVDHFIERLWRPLLCRPKYNLVVVAIFKNEAVAIREWLLHHIRQGVEHFYLINNGSTDDWQSQVEGLPVTVYTDNEKYKQCEHYNDYFLDIVKLESRWVAVIDLDEFLYARDPYPNIKRFLLQAPNEVSQILIRWKMFGSSGHIKQPQSIRKGFYLRKLFPQSTRIPPDLFCGDNGLETSRVLELIEKETDPKVSKQDYYVKGIVRSSNLKRFGVHNHQFYGGNTLIFPSLVTEASLMASPIHLNHYAIQSLNWYNNVKVTRGDASQAASDKVRNAEYFKKYDFKDIEDLELSRIVNNDVSLWNKPSLHAIRKEFTRVTPEQWKEENVEQGLIHKYILPGDVILELGGNIGRSSIIACQVAGDNGSLVVSESDEENREELAQNMRGALCNFRIVPAFSDTPLYQKGWVTKDTPEDGFNSIETIPYRELSSYSPTVLVIDCEGCFDDILHKADLDLSNVHTIILENDGSKEQNKRIKDTLLKDFSSIECRNLENDSCFWEVLQRRSKIPR